MTETRPPWQAEYLQRCEDLIDAHGWMIQSVPEIGLSYTVGLTPRALPEFVMTNTDHRHAARILNEIARRTTTAPAILALTDGTTTVVAGAEYTARTASPQLLGTMKVARVLYGADRIRAIHLLPGGQPPTG